MTRDMKMKIIIAITAPMLIPTILSTERGGGPAVFAMIIIVSILAYFFH